jgi:hypothetical protein
MEMLILATITGAVLTAWFKVVRPLVRAWYWSAVSSLQALPP